MAEGKKYSERVSANLGLIRENRSVWKKIKVGILQKER